MFGNTAADAIRKADEEFARAIGIAMPETDDVNKVQDVPQDDSQDDDDSWRDRHWSY